jgi:hypothetical protein
MQMFDEHPMILQWSSEPLKIPYIHPATNKKTNYVPDFLVIYQNKNKEKICELIEVKPENQTTLENAGRSKSNKIHAIINEAKWKSAKIWCEHKGITFRILTEKDIFKK